MAIDFSCLFGLRFPVLFGSGKCEQYQKSIGAESEVVLEINNSPLLALVYRLKGG